MITVTGPPLTMLANYMPFLFLFSFCSARVAGDLSACSAFTRTRLEVICRDLLSLKTIAQMKMSANDRLLITHHPCRLGGLERREQLQQAAFCLQQVRFGPTARRSRVESKLRLARMWIRDAACLDQTATARPINLLQIRWRNINGVGQRIVRNFAILRDVVAVLAEHLRHFCSRPCPRLSFYF